MFPVLLLVIFASIFGSDTVEIRGGHIDTDTYYVPAIIQPLDHLLDHAVAGDVRW